MFIFTFNIFVMEERKTVWGPWKSQCSPIYEVYPLVCSFEDIVEFDWLPLDRVFTVGRGCAWEPLAFQSLARSCMPQALPG